MVPELDVEGLWWLPGDSERNRGRLSFETHGGGSLRLEKPLPGFATLAPLVGEIPLILGQAFDHQKYSLVGGWDQARAIGGGPFAQMRTMALHWPRRDGGNSSQRRNRWTA